MLNEYLDKTNSLYQGFERAVKMKEKKNAQKFLLVDKAIHERKKAQTRVKL